MGVRGLDGVGLEGRVGQAGQAGQPGMNGVPCRVVQNWVVSLVLVLNASKREKRGVYLGGPGIPVLFGRRVPGMEERLRGSLSSERRPNVEPLAIAHHGEILHATPVRLARPAQPRQKQPHPTG